VRICKVVGERVGGQVAQCQSGLLSEQMFDADIVTFLDWISFRCRAASAIPLESSWLGYTALTRATRARVPSEDAAGSKGVEALCSKRRHILAA
jgi:hypothetical protein